MQRRPGVITVVQILLSIDVLVSTLLVIAVIASLATGQPTGTNVLILALLAAAETVLVAFIIVHLAYQRRWARLAGIIMSFAGMAMLWFGPSLVQGYGQGLYSTFPILNLVTIGCLISRDAREWCTE